MYNLRCDYYIMLRERFLSRIISDGIRQCDAFENLIVVGIYCICCLGFLYAHLPMRDVYT